VEKHRDRALLCPLPRGSGTDRPDCGEDRGRDLRARHAFYDHRPDSKVSFIIRDVDDVANGAAYFYENRIEILAPSMDFEFRGTHTWLRNVVTHEFTHVVQIQTAMKFGRTVPGIYLQWLNYESERRPDVLYGYPNVVASYPYSGFVVPVWFAEGWPSTTGLISAMTSGIPIVT